MFESPSSAPALPNVPQSPPPPPMFGANAAPGSKPKAKGSQSQSTFLGAGAIPDPSQLGGKTLLGQ